LSASTKRLEEKENILLPVGLLLLTVITRLPFMSKYLYHMDSVQFALALEKYDITVHQPHPPGYFLYVMLGRLINLLFNDANTTFIFISIFFSGLTVVTIYYLGKEIFDQRTGLFAALIALTSPNMWFHGEVALSYTVEAFFSTVVALLSWRMLRGEHKYIWLSVVLLGIAGGMRQNTVIFLLPLWLYSVRRLPVRKVVMSIGLLGITCLLWFIPMVWMTGGWSNYQKAVTELWLFNTGNVSVFEKGWATLKIFSSSLFEFIVYGIGVGILTLGLTVYAAIRHKKVRHFDVKKVHFFSLWILPSVLFYLLIFIHPANPGYVLIFLPALLILVAVSTIFIGTDLKNVTKRDFIVPIVLAMVIFNLGIFLFSKYPVSYRIIRTHDHDLSIMIEGIRNYDPLKTAVLIGPYIFYGYRHIMYYLPDYVVYQIDIRTAQTGERREIFWGVNKETFLADEIVLPKNTDNLLCILVAEDKDKAKEIGNLTLTNLSSTNIYIASGHISLIRHLYPELKVRYGAI